MFGALFFLYIFCSGLYSIFKNCKITFKNMNETYDPLSNTYISYKGTLVDMDTGEARFTCFDSNHDKWLHGKNIQSINLSQKQREIEYEKLKKNPGQRTAIFFESEPINIVYGDGTKRGRRYKDLFNGDLYVVRLDKNGRAFYVRVKDNKVIRYTDRYISYLSERNSYNKEEEVVAIKAFQDKIDKAKEEPFWRRHDPTLIGDSQTDYKG